MPGPPPIVARGWLALALLAAGWACSSKRAGPAPAAPDSAATAVATFAPAARSPPGAATDAPLGSPDRRLTRFELAYAVEDAFGVRASALHDLPPPVASIGDVPDIVVGRLLDRSPKFLTPYRQTVRALAAEIAGRLAGGCAERAILDCIAGQLREPAARLWRSLDADLTAPLVAAARSQTAAGPRAMFQAAIARLLDDERFYVLQLEAPRAGARASGLAFERRRLASRLALALWSSVPDRPLLERAEAGGLDEPARIAAEVERMMADPRFSRFSRELARQWLRLDHPPAFRPSLNERRLVEDPARLEAALEQAARIIGRQLQTGEPVGRLLDPKDGLLTSTAVLGAISTEIRGGGEETWLGRGLVVQSAFLCRTFPLAAIYPLKLWQDHPLLNPHVVATTKRPGERTLLEMRTRDAPCRACHRQLETIGATLWMYDGLGRPSPRAEPANVSIAGQRVDGPKELARWILASGRFEPCLAQKVLTYLLARAVLPAKREADRHLVAGLVGASGPPQTLARWIARALASDAFRVPGPDVVHDKPTPAPSSNDYVDPLPPAPVTDGDCARFDPGAFLVDGCGSSACHGPGAPSGAFAVADRAEAARLLRAAEPLLDGYCKDEPGLVNTTHPADSLVIRKLTAGAAACGGPMPLTGGPRTLDPRSHACFVRWIEQVARGAT